MKSWRAEKRNFYPRRESCLLSCRVVGKYEGYLIGATAIYITLPYMPNRKKGLRLKKWNLVLLFVLLSVCLSVRLCFGWHFRVFGFAVHWLKSNCLLAPPLQGYIHVYIVGIGKTKAAPTRLRTVDWRLRVFVCLIEFFGFLFSSNICIVVAMSFSLVHKYRMPYPYPVYPLWHLSIVLHADI